MQLHLALGRQERVIILDEQHKVHLSLSQADACRALLAHAELMAACEACVAAMETVAPKVEDLLESLFHASNLARAALAKAKGE